MRRPDSLPEMSADRDALEAPPYSAAPVEVLRLPGGGQELDRVAVARVLPLGGPRASPGLAPADLAANTVEVDAPGFAPAKALPVLERRLASNELRLGDLLAELDTAVVDADAALLVNVNCPADLAAIRP